MHPIGDQYLSKHTFAANPADNSKSTDTHCRDSISTTTSATAQSIRKKDTDKYQDLKDMSQRNELNEVCFPEGTMPSVSVLSVSLHLETHAFPVDTQEDAPL
jgi:hypothetical protein